MADSQNQGSSSHDVVENGAPGSSSSAAEQVRETAESSEASSSSPPSGPEKTCTHCKKLSSEAKPLKPCTKCQSVQYCSRECQKSDFKIHKKICAAKAQEYSQTADLKMEAPRKPGKDGFRGGLQKWQFDT